MKKLRAFVLCLLVLALLAGGLWFGNNVLQTEEFTFRSGDLPAGFDGWRVMVLADLHGKSFGSQQEKLLAAVKNEAPEAIFLIGDLVDERTEDAEGYCTQLGAALSALAPTYYVTGNHEWARHDAPAIKKILQEAGVTVLSNEFLPIGRGDDTVILAGIDDPNGYADQKTPEQLASELYAACGDPFWLLLAHRNDHFAAQYSLLGADLTISGHGHGGCIRLPFTDGLLGTQRNLLPSHTAGFYEDNGCTLFVTRGLGNVGITFRVFNRPQIAVITVEKEG